MTTFLCVLQQHDGWELKYCFKNVGKSTAVWSTHGHCGWTSAMLWIEAQGGFVTQNIVTVWHCGGSALQLWRLRRLFCRFTEKHSILLPFNIPHFVRLRWTLLLGFQFFGEMCITEIRERFIIPLSTLRRPPHFHIESLQVHFVQHLLQLLLLVYKILLVVNFALL